MTQPALSPLNSETKPHPPVPRWLIALIAGSLFIQFSLHLPQYLAGWKPMIGNLKVLFSLLWHILAKQGGEGS